MFYKELSGKLFKSSFHSFKANWRSRGESNIRITETKTTGYFGKQKCFSSNYSGICIHLSNNFVKGDGREWVIFYHQKQKCRELKE